MKLFNTIFLIWNLGFGIRAAIIVFGGTESQISYELNLIALILHTMFFIGQLFLLKMSK